MGISPAEVFRSLMPFVGMAPDAPDIVSDPPDGISPDSDSLMARSGMRLEAVSAIGFSAIATVLGLLAIEISLSR